MSTLWQWLAPRRHDRRSTNRLTTSCTILCVDDDPLIAAAISRMLIPQRIDVISAYSGPHGYWQVVMERPDLVIADLSMPNGDGMELVSCMRSNQSTAGIPVIILTGAQDPHVRHVLEDWGVAAYLQKPVSGQALVTEICRHLPLQAEKRQAGANRLHQS